jgi:hypothetical protein
MVDVNEVLANVAVLIFKVQLRVTALVAVLGQALLARGRISLVLIHRHSRDSALRKGLPRFSRVSPMSRG